MSTTTSYKINLYWIRHGYSCANVVRDTLGSTDILHGSLLSRSTYSPDAQLADHGVKQVEKAAENNKDILGGINVVLTSELRRAIETALILFKNYNVTIYPVPYINEDRNSLLEFFNLDKDNSSMGLEGLQKYLEENYKNSNKVNYTLLKELKNKKGTSSADIDKFFKIVIPIIIRDPSVHINKNGPTNIAVVSHHKFIEHHLKEIKKDIPYINNADIYVENLTIILDKDGSFSSKASQRVDKCGGDLACKVSVEVVGQTEQLQSDSYQRCEEKLKERLGDVSYTPKELKKHKGGYYKKYMENKLIYLQLKEQLGGINTNQVPTQLNWVRDDGNGDEKVKRHLSIGYRMNFEGFNRRDWDIAGEPLDENIIMIFSDGTKLKGKGPGMDMLMKEIIEWAPDTKITSHRTQFGSGDWTCINLIIEGTFTRPMKAMDGTTIQPTWKRFMMSNCGINHWKNDKIDKLYVFGDSVEFMKQLGIRKMGMTGGGSSCKNYDHGDNYNKYIKYKSDYLELKHMGGKHNVDGGGNNNKNVKRNLGNLHKFSFDGFNKRNWNLIRDIFDTNITVTLPNNMEISGSENIINIIKHISEWAPDSKMVEQRIRFGSGDWTCANIIGNGTFTHLMRTLDGTIIQPTGKKFIVSNCVLGFWENGKLVRVYLFTDSGYIMKQLDIGKLWYM